MRQRDEAWEKKRLIRKAYNFNSHARRMASCNHLYMGSMATCQLIHALGGQWPNDALNDVLKKATNEQLDAGLALCQNILKYADRNGSAKADTYIPTDRKRWANVPGGGLVRQLDKRIRCSRDHKVVFRTEQEAELSAARATGRGVPMKPYLGKCGHWHTARIKR
jgi:hypothetical protein